MRCSLEQFSVNKLFRKHADCGVIANGHTVSGRRPFL